MALAEHILGEIVRKKLKAGTPARARGLDGRIATVQVSRGRVDWLRFRAHCTGIKVAAPGQEALRRRSVSSPRRVLDSVIDACT